MSDFDAVDAAAMSGDDVVLLAGIIIACIVMFLVPQEWE